MSLQEFNNTGAILFSQFSDRHNSCISMGREVINSLIGESGSEISFYSFSNKVYQKSLDIPDPERNISQVVALAGLEYCENLNLSKDDFMHQFKNKIKRSNANASINSISGGLGCLIILFIIPTFMLAKAYL
jgi:hypothetical protein